MKKSHELFIRAQKVIPGGVNSPVRAFKGVGGEPIFFEQGVGAYLFDVDGNKYIDYVGSWGPLIIGHCHPNVLTAVSKVLEKGMSFGAPTELEIELAEKVTGLVPSIEKIRMVNSGTEATMTAIRLARGFTKKSKIIKFNGCYHGHSDSLLVQSGSGLLTLGIPNSPGVLADITQHTLVAEFNDLDMVARYFAQYSKDIAGIIIEPIAGNMGLVLPEYNFLVGLRELCDKHGSLLIFDEVMTGFRVAKGGAQELYKIRPDLTTLGKIIGGGMPVGAIGGRDEIMSCLAPEGMIYQAGTLSGNPLAMAAGLATLQEIEKPGFYDNLSNKSSTLIRYLAQVCKEINVPFCGDAVGGMFGFCFTDKDKIRSYTDVASSDEKLFKKFYHGMLNKGIYFAPSLFEAGFVSSMHEDIDLMRTKDAAKSVLASLSLNE